MGAALDRVDQVVEEGAGIVDIGGVEAVPGVAVGPEEADRVVALVEEVRRRHPDVVLSVDTYRASVGDLVCRAGADLLNNAWGGWEPELAEVAARHDVGLVCPHTGGLPPRTRPHRVQYEDVVADVTSTVGLAERAVALGVRPDAVLVALSRKDVVGEALDLGLDERLEGTLAATAVSALLGACAFRAHDVAATVRTVRMAAAITGSADLTVGRRGRA